MLNARTLAGIALIGLTLAGCGGSASPAPVSPASPSAPATAQPSAAAAQPASGAAATASAKPAGTWDDMVAAAKKEGKVTIFAAPDPDSRTKIPPLFKQRFGIDVEYVTFDASRLGARMESERAANQYLWDVVVTGADTVYGLFVAREWLDPLKPALLMPEVADTSKWKGGKLWFRDAKGELVLQIFNTVSMPVTINTQFVQPKDLATADALLDPKWKGKISAFDPSVNGTGLASGSALYVNKGQEFVTKLYKEQVGALTRDYQQAPEWLAHGTYPIGIAVGPNYMERYKKAGLNFAEPEFSDSPGSVSAGFGLINLINKAPHPNAARVFANWMASKEALTVYGETQGQVPTRNDVDPTWALPTQLPKDGVNYLDTYAPDFVTTKRTAVRDFYQKLLS